MDLQPLGELEDTFDGEDGMTELAQKMCPLDGEATYNVAEGVEDAVPLGVRRQARDLLGIAGKGQFLCGCP